MVGWGSWLVGSSQGGEEYERSGRGRKSNHYPRYALRTPSHCCIIHPANPQTMSNYGDMGWKHVVSSLGRTEGSPVVGWLAYVHGLGSAVPSSWCCPLCRIIHLMPPFPRKNQPSEKWGHCPQTWTIAPAPWNDISNNGYNKLWRRYFDTSQITFTSLCTLFCKTRDVCAISFSLFSISGHRSLLSQHMTQTPQFKI